MNFEITPLGAAIVEALPDQKKKRKIQARFKNQLECPVSLMFDADQIKRYYQGKIKPVGKPKR